MAAKLPEREALKSGSEKRASVYAGWIYHVGLNSVGYQFCHPRYLVIKGKYVEMYKRDPTEFPSKKPIRRGVAGKFTMVKEIGRKIVNGRFLYVLEIFSRIDHDKRGEIACTSAEEVEKWMSAFRHAKEEAEYESSKLSFNEAEFNVNGPRYYSKSYLSKLIYIGRGPESLLRRPSVVAQEPNPENYYNKRASDAVEQTDWRCFHTVNGLRIFEDVKSESTIMKSVGVVEATPDMIFEMIMSLNILQRHQWDTLTGQLELLEQIDGHSDIVYGTFDPKYFRRQVPAFATGDVTRMDDILLTKMLLGSADLDQSCLKNDITESLVYGAYVPVDVRAKNHHSSSSCWNFRLTAPLCCWGELTSETNTIIMK